MNSTYSTDRITLCEINLDDVGFISELVNTPGWLKFIGDRNIHTQEQAKAYVEQIMENPKIKYWVVKLKSKNTSIGIVTFIKRDYLEHSDVGFAFLPEYAKNGFAYEATSLVLNDAIKRQHHRQILATTIQENANSIKLLERLGFKYERQMENGKNSLLIYCIDAEKLLNNQTNTRADMR